MGDHTKFCDMTATETCCDGQCKKCCCCGMDQVAASPGPAFTLEGVEDPFIRPNAEPFAVSASNSETLYAFMGWLTSRDEVSGPFSASETCGGEAAVLVDTFCKSQGFANPSGRWPDRLKPYPSSPGVDGDACHVAAIGSESYTPISDEIVSALASPHGGEGFTIDDLCRAAQRMASELMERRSKDSRGEK